jgi:hypothetical protein
MSPEILAFLGVLAAVVSPVLLSHFNNRALRQMKQEEARIRAADREAEAKLRSEEKKEDWRRQDEVAAAAVSAAEMAAGKVAEAAADLKRQNAKVSADAKAAADTADRILVMGTEQAKATAQIHTLVNSNMTTTMEATLVAYRSNLASLKELAALRQDSGREPSTVALTAIEQQEEQIRLLESQLEKRAEATERADAIKDRETPTLVTVSNDVVPVRVMDAE